MATALEFVALLALLGLLLLGLATFITFVICEIQGINRKDR